MESKKRICVIGAGPCGMAALCHFAKIDGANCVDVVCYEKQKTWGGLWNYSWKTGRWTRNVDLRPYIKFNTVVRHVQYNEADDKFIVENTNLETDESSKEYFDYVIVATGIFNVPNIPDFPGIDSFEGRILHAHNFRDALEFKGQRLLIIGARFSAEDLALQCIKFGAKSVVCTWRTKPMEFKWPKGIEERPLVQNFEGKTARFKDGSNVEIDDVLLCTGYKYSFPFMENKLRLNSPISFFPNNLYKGSLYLPEGNNKLFYMGIQDQYYSFTMFDVQAIWICKLMNRIIKVV